MNVAIPDEVLQTSGMTEADLKLELAVMLFEREKLTLAQASLLAGMDQLRFQRVLGVRRIPIHYGVEEFEEDLRVLRELGRL